MKKKKITKGEKILYFGSLTCLTIAILVQVFCGANIGHLNMSVEKLKYDITSQNKKNESLAMQVNELTSFDKIEKLVKEMGLAYKYENIVVVDE